MKKYEKLIEDTMAKIDAYKKINKGHSAYTTQSNLNQLQKAINKGDEKAAEAAAEKLSEIKKIEVLTTHSADVPVLEPPIKKKNSKN